MSKFEINRTTKELIRVFLRFRSSFFPPKLSPNNIQILFGDSLGGRKKTFCNFWFFCKYEAFVNCGTLNATKRGYCPNIYIVKLEKTRRELFCNGNVWVRLTLLPSQRAVGVRGQKAIPSPPYILADLKYIFFSSNGLTKFRFSNEATKDRSPI